MIKNPGSFRDPSGFIFERDSILYRQINDSYRDNYDLLMSSGLYDELVKAGMMVAHEEVSEEPAEPDGAYKILRPERIPFISYPYAWCFSGLKDAALLMLEIQEKALAKKMSLKDASSYNIQFTEGRPVFIDTLSFERYDEGKPWIAYAQFCRHFLAPLALMAFVDARLGRLLRLHLDGIPLDLAASILPLKTRFSPGLLVHIHLHTRAQQHYKDKNNGFQEKRISRYAVPALIESLKKTVSGLKYELKDTDWKEYYSATNYSDGAFTQKKEIVKKYIEKTAPGIVWDLGANTGMFSHIAAESGAVTISLESNHDAVESSYRSLRKEEGLSILPLVMDLTNPSPGTGWENHERFSLVERGPCDLALALALIHHLAISNNVPFKNIASFMSLICRSLVIEFVPKEDSYAQRLLINREDIFTDYTKAGFEESFTGFFNIEESVPIKDSSRVLYLMRKKDDRTGHPGLKQNV